jgi:DNA adenine methylase
MSHNSQKLIAFNYFGGKYSWLDNLYGAFPPKFTHLVELFCGSCAVSINYRNRAIITVNDINDDVTNFFEVLRNNPDQLIGLLLLTPCSQAEYNHCWTPCDEPVEKARRFYVRVRQSFFGLGAQRKNKGWHMAKSQLNTNRGETVSRWNNATEKLIEVAKIIRQNFQVTSLPYADVIDKLDFDEAFFYCDPPYVLASRKSSNDYKFEFTDADHIDLSEKLHAIKGMAMVSGYNSELYDELYADWNKIVFPKKKNHIRSGEVQEVVWTNYATNQLNLPYKY